MCSFTLSKLVFIFYRIPRRFEQHSVEQEPMKTTVTFITDVKEKDGMRSYPPYVTSYSSQGFNIKGIKVFGSVAILPTIFYHWRVRSYHDFQPFFSKVIHYK